VFLQLSGACELDQTVKIHHLIIFNLIYTLNFILLGGLSPQAGYLTEQIISLPEISRTEMPSFDIKEYIPLIDSSQMGPDNWAEIADDIGKNYFDYDGFVVIMGTGVLRYIPSLS
jgi:hypothetical protein